ncbi:Ribonuclease P protein subunit p30 [Phytophthora boehmeriae]|uniref:Ribonuclease P protein subunit p30 n=1 Tax=Phytophthora boehmeriae TaxID=109152 RepID=A0A8T1WS61_9STRA|nr:Ribonuclease P protein subunit p30 [Phytophthora boehmeriae]
MVYVDLNVRATAKVSAGELQRLGYATVCVNVDCDNDQKPKEASTVPDLQLAGQREKTGKTAKKAKLYTPALANGLQFKNTSGGDKKELPRQRKRITLKLEDATTAQRLLCSDVVKGYDVVAAEATTAKVFQYLCEQGDLDLITFDVTNRLPFSIKRPWIAAAIKRSIYFEITYTPCLGDTAGRRYFFLNASNLVRLTGGKNLVFSSGATRDILLRSPYDVVNIGLLSGLKYGQALDAISTSCQAVLEHADRRRGVVGGVQVEASEDVVMKE